MTGFNAVRFREYGHYNLYIAGEDVPRVLLRVCTPCQACHTLQGITSKVHFVGYGSLAIPLGKPADMGTTRAVKLYSEREIK